VQDRRYLERAVALTESMLEHFWDTHAAGFFFTSDDHPALIVRSKPAFDGSIPSGNSVAARNLLRLHHYTERQEFLDRADAMLRRYAGQMREQPFGFANMLCTADFSVHKPREIVIVGQSDAADTQVLLQRIRGSYVPNRTLSVIDPRRADPLPALLAGKGQLNGKPTVYVCHNMTCSAPVTAWTELEPLLRG
jgi:uncharacterized protein